MLASARALQEAAGSMACSSSKACPASRPLFSLLFSSREQVKVYMDKKIHICIYIYTFVCTYIDVLCRGYMVFAQWATLKKHVPNRSAHATQARHALSKQ